MHLWHSSFISSNRIRCCNTGGILFTFTYRICSRISAGIWFIPTTDLIRHLWYMSFIATTRFAYAFLPSFPFILIHSFAHTFLPVFRSFLQQICLGISVKHVHIYTGFAYAFLLVFRSYSYLDLFTHFCWYFVHFYNEFA